jgi:predicted phage tail protein
MDKAGASGGRAPSEAKDNLISTQYAEVIDLLSEGEIYGLKDGAKSIFLDNTPLMDDNGNFNFKNVDWYERTGTQLNAPVIPFGSEPANEVSVGVTVEKDTPVTRTITDNSVEAVRITISVPQLQRFTNKGDIVGSSFEFKIEVRYSGGSFESKVSGDLGTIKGRSADKYQRDYEIELDGAFPVDIRITRITADPTSAKVSNTFQWTSYTEITRAKLSYPNSAIVGLRVDAEQFSNIPTRSYLVRGIKVAIPSNGTVNPTDGSISYAGIWDFELGTAAWTTDPAWILWDLLTSSRYGFGDHIKEAMLDKSAFYAASRYCSEQVDGEPRFSCNVNIQTAEEAYTLINDMCSVFRAMPYWSAGTLTINQDSPQDTAYLFTAANVTPEGFSYQGASLKSKPTVAIVSYLDLELRDIAKEVVEDRDGINRYGVVTTEVSAFACTSRKQARRLGEWLLYTNRYEGEVISFSTSIDAGVLVRPGQVIEVSDPTRSQQRRGGRITSATTTAITVDNATGLTVGTSPTLSVILADGTVEAKTVSTIVGNVITVSSAYTSAPSANSIWVYQTADIETSTWRVISVTEQEQIGYSVTAIAYNSSKYDYIERDQPLQERDVTNLNVIPPPPTGLSAVEALYNNNGIVESKLVLTWIPVDGIGTYRFRYRQEDNNWTELTVQRPDYEILDTSVGVYEIEVYSISSTNLRSSSPATLLVSVSGKTAPPASPTDLSLVAIDEASAIISWKRSDELDVILNGKVLIRHQPVLTAATWENAQEIVAAAAGSQTQKQVPLLEGTYLIKFEDDSGNRSITPALIIVDLPTPLPRLTVQTYAHPPFTGSFDGMFYSAEQGGILLGGTILVDDMGIWDDLGSIDTIGDILPSGTYTLNNTLDLNGVYDVNVRRLLEFSTFVAGALFDDKTLLIDEWGLIDDSVPDGPNASMYVRTTDDNPAGTPSWSAWREFANATVRGRALQFKVVATTIDPTQNILISDLAVYVEMQQRTEASAVIASSTVSDTYDFATPFYQAPSVGVTVYTMNSNDELFVDAVTRTGFDLEIIHGGTPQSHDFTFTAVGYGKEII